MKTSTLVVGGIGIAGLVYLLTRPTTAAAGTTNQTALNSLAAWVKQQLSVLQQSTQKALQDLQKSMGGSKGGAGAGTGAAGTGGVGSRPSADSSTRAQLASALGAVAQTGVANLPTKINWFEFSAGEKNYLSNLYDNNGNLLVRTPDATNILASDLSFLSVPLSGADLVGVVPGAPSGDLSFLGGEPSIPSIDPFTFLQGAPQSVPGADWLNYSDVGFAGPDYGSAYDQAIVDYGNFDYGFGGGGVGDYFGDYAEYQYF